MADCLSLLNLPPAAQASSSAIIMARTRSQARKAKALALKNPQAYKFKAAIVDHILNNQYIEENRQLQVSVNLLTEALEFQETLNSVIQHNLRISRQLVQDGHHMRAAIEDDQRFLDEFVRDVFIEHPAIAYQYRNRIAYSDIPTPHPDEEGESTEEEEFNPRSLFGDSDDEPEDIVSREDRLWRENDF